MALALARNTSVATRPLALATVVAARRPSSVGDRASRRPRRLTAPVHPMPAQSRIVLRGNSVLFR